MEPQPSEPVAAGEAAWSWFPRAAVEEGIVRRFEAVVARHADRLAVADGAERWSYGRLDAAANRVARAIVAHGTTSDAPVALLVEQGTENAVAILGTLKAGGFYVPLDPGHPDARCQALLADAQPRLVVTSAMHAARARALAGDTPTLVLDALPPHLPDDALATKPGPSDRAYVLYTSGSTGRPKGVLQDHAHVVHNVWRHANPYGITGEDRVSLVYPCSVYGGTRDLFLALLCGASLWRYPLEQRGVERLAEWIRDGEISVYCSVATVFRRLVQRLGDERLATVRLVKLGGEAIYRTDVESFQRHTHPDARLSLGLASTEVGAVRQFFADQGTRFETSRVPCGFPIPEVDVRILDADGRPVGPGESGEIVVTSRFIARGYWRREEETAQAFGADPADAGMRRFRMGDLGHVAADGHLVHEGRRDRQVKVRGNRVEVPEVEVALLEQPEVAEAAVVTEAPRPGEERLVAFAVPRTAGQAPDPEDLLRRLRARLPPAMVPARIGWLDALPLLPNGKVDRDRLARMSAEAPSPPPSAHDASATQATLVALWEEVLARAPVGVHDDFFALGGDSLRMVRLVLEAERRLNVALPLTTLVEAPTVAAMAALVERVRHGEGRVEVVLHTPGEGFTTGVVPIQPRGRRAPLFLVAPAGGSVLPFYALAHHLGPDQPLYGLEVSIPVRRRRLEMPIPVVAAQLLGDVRRVAPRGPLRLGGWSYGGFVAWEMAARLAARGETVDRLLIIGSDTALIEATITPAGVVRSLAMLAQLTWYARPFARDELYVALARGESPRGLLGRLRRRLLRVRSAPIADVLASDPRLQEIRHAPSGIVGNLRHYIRAIARYRPQPAPLAVDWLRPARDGRRRVRPGAARFTCGWERYAQGGVRVHLLPGNHFTVFQQQHVGRLAATILRILADR